MKHDDGGQSAFRPLRREQVAIGEHAVLGLIADVLPREVGQMFSVQYFSFQCGLARWQLTQDAKPLLFQNLALLQPVTLCGDDLALRVHEQRRELRRDFARSGLSAGETDSSESDQENGQPPVSGQPSVHNA